MNSIELKELTFTFPKTQLFQALNFNLEARKDLIITGPNACGKTTLLKLIAGILKPLSGNVDVSSILDSKTYIPVRNDGFYPRLTGKENISIFYAGSKSELSARIDKWRSIEIFDLTLDTKFKDCSIGMKQILNIFILTLHNPKLILMDEPFKNLDPNITAKIIKLLTETQPQSVIILSAHAVTELEWPRSSKILELEKC